MLFIWRYSGKEAAYRSSDLHHNTALQTTQDNVERLRFFLKQYLNPLSK